MNEYKIITIKLLYFLILNRKTDPSENEVQGHVRNIDRISLENVIASFLSSKERINLMLKNPGYDTVLPSLDTQTFDNLSDVISNLLNRTDKSKIYFFYLMGELALHFSKYEAAMQCFNSFLDLNKNSDAKIYVTARFDKAKAKTKNLEYGPNFRSYTDCVRFYSKIRYLKNCDVLSHDTRYENGIKEGGLNIVEYRSELLNSPEIIAASLIQYYISNPLEQESDVFYESVRVALNLLNFNQDDITYVIGLLKSLLMPIENLTSRSERSADDDNLKLIIVGGFHYSGSSAIYDYLRGHSSVLEGLSESFFDRKEKEFSLVKKLHNLWSKPVYLRKEKDLIEFLFKNALGIKTPFNYYDYGIITSGSVAESFINKSLVKEYLSGFKYILQNYTDSSITKEDFFYPVVNILKIIHGKEVYEKSLVLNQAPTAMSIGALSIYPKGTVYCSVKRDPRDQYITLINGGYFERKDYLDVYDFIEKYKKRFNYFNDTTSTMSSDYCFFEVQFEEFVLSESYRSDLCDALTIPYKESRNFFPEQSSKNIGIHSNFKDQRSIEIIEQELTEYLWHG